VIRIANRFVLEKVLGSGGMARVFLGRDEVLDRPVAVKLLNPVHGGTDIGDRFEREGRTAARLAHPNIVQVYDAGEAEFDGRETSYIVMEYVSGGDLKELIDEKGRLPGPELARLGEEICAGLAHAHERGVIHRDIKPHNILLDENGHVKVTDFGIARALDTTQATRTGSFLGTALYSSPEQLQGQKVTPKSDVYSLGATLYQAAAGEPPFTGQSPIEIASQHVSQNPTPPRSRSADVSVGLEALILNCLAKTPDDRPTAEEARSRFEAEIRPARATQAQSGASPTTPTRTGQTRKAPAAPPPRGRIDGTARYGRPERRRRGLLAALALIAVLVVIVALAAPNLLGGGDQNAQQDNAQVGGNRGQPDGGGGGNRGLGGGDKGGGVSPSASASASSGGSPPSQDNSGHKEFTAQAAEDTVEEFYRTTSEGDYDRSARLLSDDYRQSTFPDQATFEGTFDKVERVVFIEGPNAKISGTTATVTGETQATLTKEVQHNKGTWYLVQEDGRWKIDGWDVVQLSSRSA
jgi:eukaryotic-like serine/threonine-protein kinase